MTDNRTSRVVEEMLMASGRDETWAIYQRHSRKYARQIAEKYQRMEQTLGDIRAAAKVEKEKYPELFWYERQAEKALYFDPLHS